MRTVSKLLNLDGYVYVYLRGKNIINLFLKNAEAEGFTYGDGVKPTEREGADIMVLNRDWTICFAGMAGRLAFRSFGMHSEINIFRVDYGKYLSGAKKYLILNKSEMNKCLNAGKTL